MNTMNQTKTISRRRQWFYAYLVTAWLMHGVFVCYVAFTTSYRHYFHNDLAGLWGSLLVTLPISPFFFGALELTNGIDEWHQQNYLLSAAYFAAAFAFIPLWWGVWYALYGKNQGAGSKFLRP